MTPDYDLVVVGSGPAGEKAAALAAFHGHTVAVVERSATPGGTMVAGVATSKTMREAALYLTSFRRREVYGVGVEVAPEVAALEVRHRADRVEKLLTAAVATNLERHGISLIQGSARLADAHSVTVTPPSGPDRTLEAKVILLATGSRPAHPPGIDFSHPDVLDSDTARDLDRPVARLAVIGGGAVACEYASIFAALGSAVTLIESRGRLLPFLDAEIADLLTAALRDMGVDVRLGAGHAVVAAEASGLCVRGESGELARPDTVIVAAGRVGNTEGLGLADVGVATDERGLIVVDEHGATSLDGVYAAGDVTGPPALASVSMEQGRVAACHAFGIPLREAVDRATPFGVYTIPEAAMLGLTEEAARAAGEDVVVGRARLERNARTAISGASHGLVKLVVRRADRRLVGAHVLSEDATELIHQAQAVMHFGGTIDYFINATYNVPTESEAYKYAAYDALSRLEDRPTLTAGV